MYDNNNVFAKMLRGEMKCTKVFENDFAIAFKDIFPVAPIHVLVVPKTKHIEFGDFCINADKDFVAGFFMTVNEVIDMLELEDGYRLITNSGKNGHQSVPHFHIHIIGGKKLGCLIEGDEIHKR